MQVSRRTFFRAFSAFAAAAAAAPALALASGTQTDSKLLDEAELSNGVLPGSLVSGRVRFQWGITDDQGEFIFPYAFRYTPTVLSQPLNESELAAVVLGSPDRVILTAKGFVIAYAPAY